MQNVLILGANGTIGRQVTERLLNETDAHLTLFLRNASRLTITDPARETVIEGDAIDAVTVNRAMVNQDIVFETLGGDTEHEQQAQVITAAMEKAHVSRLLWITGIGIENELTGAFKEWENQAVGDLMSVSVRAADVIKNSALNYTLIRCAWMTNDATIDYDTSASGTTVTNTIVSRASVSDYVIKLITDSTRDNRASIAVFQPSTEADSPAGY